MGIGVHLRPGRRRVTWMIIGTSVIALSAVGCSKGTPVGASSPLAVVTAGGHGTASASGKPGPTSSKSKSKKAAARATHAKTSKAGATPAANPSTSAPGTSPATSAPDPSQSTPGVTSSTPAADPSTSQPSTSGGAAFTASCPNKGSTSAPGCGSWDAAPNSGPAPDFLAGTQSSANYLDVNQDPWTGSQGPQTITAYSFQDWSVTATDTDPSNAPGEVLTFPNASVNYFQLNTAASGYNDPPAQYDLNNITSLTSDFAESMPDYASLNAEAAYDIWLNNWDTEVMVWVDTSPAKDRNLADDGDTKLGTYTFGGQTFSLWDNGSGINGYYVFLLDHSETSGTVDLLPMLKTLVQLKEIPADSPLTQIPFGWEISDTGGRAATFTLSKFDVNITG
jgi:hypothetical protein